MKSEGEDKSREAYQKEFSIANLPALLMQITDVLRDNLKALNQKEVRRRETTLTD